MVKKLLIVIGFTILLCLLISCGTTSNNSPSTNSPGNNSLSTNLPGTNSFSTDSPENLTFKIVDIKNGNEIHNADIRFIIPEINKEYNISKHKQISIPAKRMDKPSSYPYGYMTITSVKGYYPRIDHNFKLGANVDAVITLEMTPIGELENSSFVEVFHQSSDVEMAEFLNYYNLSDIY